MQLTSIQYNAIMMAINDAKNAIADNDFLDPYDDNPDGYTNDTLLTALLEVEYNIMADNIPR